MAVQLDDAGGLVPKVKSWVCAYTPASIPEIVDGSTSRHKMVFADGSFLETDMIVFSAGIRPQDVLPKSAGLEQGTWWCGGQQPVSDQRRRCVCHRRMPLWATRSTVWLPGYQMARRW
jgi:NAD(P)H-nitrite reductase large subunit